MRSRIAPHIRAITTGKRYSSNLTFEGNSRFEMWKSGYHSRRIDDPVYLNDPLAKVRERESLWLLQHITSPTDNLQEPTDSIDLNRISSVQTVVDEILSRFLWQSIGDTELVIAIGSDDYRMTSGGIQVCVGVEQSAFNQVGVNYLHVFPAQFNPSLLPSNSDPFVHFVLNGALLKSELKTHDLGTVIQDLQQRKGLRVATIAIHGLLGHDAASVITQVNHLKEIDSVFWLHDYSLVCKSYSLTHNSLRFCGAPKLDSQACVTCLHGVNRFVVLEALDYLLRSEHIDIVAPSQVAAKTFSQAVINLGLHPREIRVRPHGAFLRSPAVKSLTLPSLDGPLRVAFVGNPLSHKGWHVFATLAEVFSQNDRYRFYQFGMERGGAVKFRYLSQNGTNPQQTVGVLRDSRIDVVICWSTWPETFGLVAHEAIAAGCLVITPSYSGNIAEVVKLEQAGLVIDGESELFSLFDSGEIFHAIEIHHANRNWSREFQYSGLTMSLGQ